MNLAPFTVTLSDDRKKATMTRDKWSLTVPVADLPKWRRMYAGFIQRRPNTEKFYRPCVTALEDAMRDLGIHPSKFAEKGGGR